MPGGAVLERLRQEDCYKCEASLVYILGHGIKPCLFCVQKTNRNTKKERRKKRQNLRINPVFCFEITVSFLRFGKMEEEKEEEEKEKKRERRDLAFAG